MDNKHAVTMASLFVKRVREAGIPAQKAYLFGSFAKNTNHKWSDIDICVVSPAFTDHLDWRLRLMTIAYQTSSDIEPHPMTPQDLQNPYSPLAREILKHGILIS